MLVPQQAIARDRKGNATARIVNADNKLEPRILTVARSIGTDWLVTDGLAEGDRVVVEGATTAQTGTVVEIVQAGDKAAVTKSAP